MKVELSRPEEPDAVVATISWTDGRAVIDTPDDILLRVAPEGRPSDAGRAGRCVVPAARHVRRGLDQPGDLEWFRAVVQARIPAETSLAARFVPGVTEGGFNPAAGYRTFEQQIERLTT